MREIFFKTERILFSYWTKDDIDLAHSLWGDNEVGRYISKNGQFSNQEIVNRLNLEVNNRKQFGIQYWPVFEKDTNEFIGCCGLRPDGASKHSYEMGVHLKPKYWGKGFASEASRAVIRFAFDKLNAVELVVGHNPNNIVAKTVIEKLGFIYAEDEYYEPTGLYHPVYKYHE